MTRASIPCRSATSVALALVAAACAAPPAPAVHAFHRVEGVAIDRVLGPAGLRIEVLASRRNGELETALRAATDGFIADRTSLLPPEGIDSAARPAVLKVHVTGDRIEADVSDHSRAGGRGEDPVVDTIEYRTSRRALLVFELFDPDQHLVALFYDDAVASAVRSEDLPEDWDVPILDFAFSVAELLVGDDPVEFPPPPDEAMLVTTSCTRFWKQLLRS